MTRVVPLIHHNPRDLRSLILIQITPINAALVELADDLLDLLPIGQVTMKVTCPAGKSACLE